MRGGTYMSAKKATDLTLYRIKEILQEQKPLLEQKYHIKEIGIFGSYVRGDQHQRSDVDILVDFNMTISAFSFIDLKYDLTDKLGVKVDLVAKNALKPRIGKHILEEVTYI